MPHPAGTEPERDGLARSHGVGLLSLTSNATQAVALPQEISGRRAA
ncbi:MAG: hypothetical protein VKK62_07275 [Synechococcaceae cyanobacterium]|nr:hypothetical protein [Synechococcaceae cyanobacterium]